MHTLMISWRDIRNPEDGGAEVVTEANALGTPALRYRVPGLIVSTKEGKTDFLGELNPEAMATRLILTINNSEHLINVSKAALEDSRQYIWNRTTSEFMTIFERG